MRTLFFSILVSSSFWASGQNLVKNYSFEEGATCDGSTEDIVSVDNWAALAGNPRFINVNCPLTKDTRSYIQGMKLPSASEGGVMAGLGIAEKGEYLQGELSVALKKGVQYVVKMRVRLPVKFCNTFINEVGVLLSADKLEYSKEYKNIDVPALALQNNDQSAIESQYNWEELSALYTANGGEQYIAIGNFSNINKGLFADRSKKECTYLFLDVVSVEEFKEINMEVFNSSAALQKNAAYILEGVVFEEGAAILKASSDKALKDLAKVLDQNSTLKIELSSHFNNSLDANGSKHLTEARAKTLLNKLVDLGVDNTRLTTVGKGSSKSIALNNTEKGRKKNNRIELKVVDL